MCPMHPEVMQEEPGTCGICGMALVPAEGSERSADERESLLPLVIPASAPLITGRRAVVYTSVPGVPGGYEGREVVLGPRAGDYYLVADGLAEGEQVVTRGNFKIDSALQIQGKPGMMTQTETPGILKGVAPQTVCPIMGGAVNRKEYTDYKGLRIYFCCPGCVETFNRDPEKVVAAMRAAGIEPEHLEGETHEH